MSYFAKPLAKVEDIFIPEWSPEDFITVRYVEASGEWGVEVDSQANLKKKFSKFSSSLKAHFYGFPYQPS